MDKFHLHRVSEALLQRRRCQPSEPATFVQRLPNVFLTQWTLGTRWVVVVQTSLVHWEEVRDAQLWSRKSLGGCEIAPGFRHAIRRLENILCQPAVNGYLFSNQGIRQQKERDRLCLSSAVHNIQMVSNALSRRLLGYGKPLLVVIIYLC